MQDAMQEEQMTRRTSVCGVGRSAASRRAANTAIELARVCGCSLLLVYVRGRPSSIWGAPFYERRLRRETRRARNALDRVVRRAVDAGVEVDTEIIEGPARTGAADLAAARGARLVVGSHRLSPAATAAVMRPASECGRRR
jgi:nucleotide-binding universal stress UspA family protein